MDYFTNMTEQNCNDKTGEISMRDYVDTRFNAIEKATDLFKETLESRLEHMNEFRAQIKDQVATFPTRQEVNTKLELIEKGRRDNLAMIVSLLAIGVSIGLYLLNYLITIYNIL